MSSILPKNELETSNFCPSLLGQKFFVRFLEELKKIKCHFEINWPLRRWKQLKIACLTPFMFYVNLLQSLWKSNLLRLWSHLHMCIKISILITYTIGLKSFWGHILLKFQCQKYFLHFRFFIDKNFKNKKPKKIKLFGNIVTYNLPQIVTSLEFCISRKDFCGMYSTTL